jgi:hypothetical protein
MACRIHDGIQLAKRRFVTVTNLNRPPVAHYDCRNKRLWQQVTHDCRDEKSIKMLHKTCDQPNHPFPLLVVKLSASQAETRRPLQKKEKREDIFGNRGNNPTLPNQGLQNSPADMCIVMEMST